MKPLINVSFAILAVCLIFVTANSTCPYDVPPTRPIAGDVAAIQGCKCDNQVLDCIGLAEIPTLLKNSTTTVVTKAIFEEGEISTVPANSLPANLTSITFYKNPLTNISENAFKNSVTTLTELAIWDAKFTKLLDVLRNLPKLTSLTFVNTHIDDWNDATVQSLGKTVLELRLNQVGLKSWPSWLKSFTLLKILDLSKNDMGLIPDDALSSMSTSLTDLYLSLTSITKIPFAVSNLPNLQLLDLSSNILNPVNNKPAVEQIATLPIAAKLSTLFIRSMNLSIIPDFAGMKKLVSVDMSFNIITNLTLERLPVNIQEIRLTSNKLTEISDSNVKNYPKLTSLYVDNIAHLTITPDAYKSLTALKNLDISNTDLDNFPENLIMLVNIETLKMNNNPLPCTCPNNPDLFRWFAAAKRDVSGICKDGRNVTEFLSGACQPTTTTTPTTTTRTTTRITNGTKIGTDDAVSPGCSLLCRFSCFFVLFLVYFYID